jgi:hypothetical protein
MKPVVSKRSQPQKPPPPKIAPTVATQPYIQHMEEERKSSNPTITSITARRVMQIVNLHPSTWEDKGSNNIDPKKVIPR